MATLTTLKDDKGGPWCVRVGLWYTGPGLAEVECVEHHRLVTVCNLRSSQLKTAKSKSIEKIVNLVMD